jgi:hypothetical protein
VKTFHVRRINRTESKEEEGMTASMKIEAVVFTKRVSNVVESRHICR